MATGYCDICNKKFMGSHNFGIVWENTHWTIQLVTYGHPVFHGKLFCSIPCVNSYANQHNLKIK